MSHRCCYCHCVIPRHKVLILKNHLFCSVAHYRTYFNLT
jgi:hypothetical protein